MTESLQQKTTDSGIPNFVVGKLDLSRHPQLARRIEDYRLRENEDFGEPGKDIGMIGAVVGFFMDNLPLLYDMLESGELAYLFEDKRDERSQESCDAKPSFRLQMGMLPYAIKRNKYFRSREARRDIGYEAARIDFIKNRAYDWGARFRPAYCAAICPESPYCDRAHKKHFVIFRESHGHV